MISIRRFGIVGLWTLLLALPSFAFDPTSPFGVTAFVPSPTRWQAMQDAMIVWNRCDFSWRSVETSQDVFNWAQPDQMVAEANARGLQIYAGLGYTPVWASSGGQTYSPPSNPADWADYVSHAVNRYKASIHVWEIWNEPNISGFWGGTRQQYIDNILKVAADAIHAADPTAKVAAPEISRCCSGDTWMLDVLNQAGNKIDIISHHQYDYVSAQNRLSASTMSIDQMHNLLVANGWGNKPIWVTECGWDSDGTGNTETTQANNLVTMLKGMETRPWWQNFMWYQIWEGATGRAGLLYQDETRKPSWYAYHDYVFASNWGPQTPFGGTARPVPGMIQAEDFDNGGPGVGYGDSDAVNSGGQYRTGEQVDIETTGDTGGGYNVGWTAGGEFLKYTINVTATGNYDIQLRVASPNNPAGTYHIQVGGINKTSTLNMPQTGGWQTYQTITVSAVPLTAGTQVFKFYEDSGGFNINWFNIVASVPPPGPATNPNPSNGATLVAITSSLSWTAGSGATSHDVNFGTTNPPPFIQNQTGTTYNPTKNPNTLYYWRIDEKNSSGTTTGTVWSFTTLPLPGAASAPNPASGATGVSTSPTLTWTAGSNATSHDVRFGTANPPPFIQNQAGTSYATGSLSGSTLYYWRIDEKNSSGTTTGTVWSFTTAGSVPTYFTNSSFESGFGAAGGGYNGSKGNGWTPYVYTGVASDLTFADETGAGNIDSGFHGQKITAGAGKEGGVYNQFSVTNGNTYTVTVRAKSGSPAGWLWFGINTSGGTDAHESSGTIYPAENARSTNWISFTWTGTATGNLITLFLDTYDGVGYWDTATPGPVTVSNSAFASDANGWNIVVWHSGPYLDGTMAFESGTGNPAGDMLAGASGATNNNDSCNREGGEINKAISTSGYPGLVQVKYDLRFNTDQTGTGCAGNCTVLEGDCADKIAVYYSTAGTGGPWTLLEQVYASSLTQNVWSTRTINCPAGANNQANFALRFRFQFNTAPTDNGRLDNIKVIGTP